MQLARHSNVGAAQQRWCSAVYMRFPAVWLCKLGEVTKGEVCGRSLEYLFGLEG